MIGGRGPSSGLSVASECRRQGYGRAFNRSVVRVAPDPQSLKAAKPT